MNPTPPRPALSRAIRFTSRNVAEIPAAFYASGQVPAGIKMQGFTNFDAFDFQHRLLDESSRQGNSFHVFNLALEQLWNQLRNVPRNNYPAGHVPGDPVPASLLTFGQWLDTNVYTPQPWGEIATSRLAPERRWYLTNVFNF